MSVFDAIDRYRTSMFPEKEGQKIILCVEDRCKICILIDNDDIKNIHGTKKNHVLKNGRWEDGGANVGCTIPYGPFTN